MSTSLEHRHTGPDLSTAHAYRRLCTPERDDATTLTRRRFLQAAGALGAGAAMFAMLPSS